MIKQCFLLLYVTHYNFNLFFFSSITCAMTWSFLAFLKLHGNQTCRSAPFYNAFILRLCRLGVFGCVLINIQEKIIITVQKSVKIKLLFYVFQTKIKAFRLLVKQNSFLIYFLVRVEIQRPKISIYIEFCQKKVILFVDKEIHYLLTTSFCTHTSQA